MLYTLCTKKKQRKYFNIKWEERNLSNMRRRFCKILKKDGDQLLNEDVLTIPDFEMMAKEG